ncbi:MAG: hypothetical protein RR341_01530 [Bacteroidales bacterium]
MRRNKRFIAGSYTSQIDNNEMQVIYYFGGASTGENKTVEIEGTEVALTEYEENQFIFWGQPSDCDAEKMKSVFIREYLEYNGCGMNEQIAAMANGGIDLTVYQALRAEAKTKVAEFLTAWNIYLSKSKDSITDK